MLNVSRVFVTYLLKPDLGHIKALDKRLKGINTSNCEQTFSWLKRYNPTLNEMRENRHKFMMLYLAQKHNEVCAKGRPEYLHPFGCKRNVSESYVRQQKVTYKKPSQRKMTYNKTSRK